MITVTLNSRLCNIRLEVHLCKNLRIYTGWQDYRCEINSISRLWRQSKTPVADILTDAGAGVVYSNIGEAAPIKMSIAQFKGKVYPDYSFSIGKVPNLKKLQKDREYDVDYSKQYDEYTEVVERGRKRYVVHDKWFSRFDDYGRFIKSSELSQKNKRYGKHGITRLGRRMVKNGAVLLERKYKISRLGFATATLPNYSRRILHILSRDWHEVTRRFFQKVKRFQEKMGCPTEMVSCTEIQPKRFRKTGVVAPHIHYIYICKTKSHSKKFTIIASLFRRYWKESVEQVIALHDGYVSEKADFNASIDCQIIKKSAAAYLGKYMSKGGEILEEIDEKGLTAFLPKQWWTATAGMKKMVKNAIITLDNETCKAIMYQLGDFLADGILTWCNYVDIMINGEERIVGCVGTFSEEHYYLLRET